jgi:hypothetical protein
MFGPRFHSAFQSFDETALEEILIFGDRHFSAALYLLPSQE